MNILALSTSTPHASVAVLSGTHLLAMTSHDDLKGHAEKLFDRIDEALKLANLSKAELHAVACDIGPGSFTGVRVAVASAKGIAFSLGLPLIGVISLRAMAAAAFGDGAAGPGDCVVATIDAKKSELFAAAFHASLEASIEPCHLRRPELHGLLASALHGQKLCIVGEAIEPLPNAVFIERRFFPSADWVGRVALNLPLAGHRPDPALIEPLYVRPPDAVPLAQTEG